MTNENNDKEVSPGPHKPIIPDVKDEAVPEPFKEDHERVKSKEEETEDALREGAKPIE